MELAFDIVEMMPHSSFLYVILDKFHKQSCLKEKCKYTEMKCASVINCIIVLDQVLYHSTLSTPEN